MSATQAGTGNRSRRGWGARALLAVAPLLWLAACGYAPTPRYADVDRGADVDGDGAADIDDGCPLDPEDGLLPKANDGCPATDPDHDGVLLADDRCPDSKEDGVGPEPQDGCGSGDSDKDGVADSQDRCPGKLEDNQDPAPNDGCPGADSDGDGIGDTQDGCPTQAETVNGYRDDDGCPDAPPVVFTFDTESSQITSPETARVDFAGGTADLTGAGQSAVAEVAKVLNAHPEIGRLEIEAHTTTKGDAESNLALSEKRAQAVAKALSGLGVAPSRLVPIGYGELCPAVDRGDNADEPKNRRVLFKAVQVRGVWQSIPRGCWRAQTLGINPTKRKPGGGGAATGEGKPASPASWEKGSSK